MDATYFKTNRVLKTTKYNIGKTSKADNKNQNFFAFFSRLFFLKYLAKGPFI